MNHTAHLEKFRQNLRRNYAIFKKVAHELLRRNIVGFNNGSYYVQPYARQQLLGIKLMKLQSLIKSESQLLLELEYAIDRENEKHKELIKNTQ